MKKAPYIVIWKGPFRRATGLGIAGREYVKALKGLGVRVVTGEAGKQKLRGTPIVKVLIYHYPPHTLRVRQERKEVQALIVNTVWETTRIPRRWVRPLNQADAVCVPSRHNKRALRQSGIRVPIYIAPHGVHAQWFASAQKRMPSKNHRFTFLSIFTFQHRKNPETLLRAYWEEFSAKDNVRLIIKTGGFARHENERWIRRRIAAYKARLKMRKTTAPLQIIARPMNEKAIRDLYRQAHVFVLPTRGEGVGLPFLEAMASGIPVIATGWGGHMDFLNPRNAYLVKYRLRPPAESMKRAISRPFRSLFAEKGQLWAEPDLKSLKAQMRAAYANPRLCRLKGARARRDAMKLTWKRGGGALKKAIEQTLRKKRIQAH